MKRLHAFVYGKVRVNFRWNTKSIADKLGLKGFVKNLDDGRVEVVAEGDEKELKKLIEYLHKGSILAKVEKVDLKFEKISDEFDGFYIR